MVCHYAHEAHWRGLRVNGFNPHTLRARPFRGIGIADLLATGCRLATLGPVNAALGRTGSHRGRVQRAMNIKGQAGRPSGPSPTAAPPRSPVSPQAHHAASGLPVPYAAICPTFRHPASPHPSDFTASPLPPAEITTTHV